MNEAQIRAYLVQVITTLLQEWQMGHDWTWYGRAQRWFDLEDIDAFISRDLTDSTSLWATWWYLDAFADALNHGFPRLDRLSWAEAVSALEGVRTCLLRGSPVEDRWVLSYGPRRGSSSQTLLRPA